MKTDAKDAVHLARQYLESPATRMAFDAEHETVLATADRRDRLDQAITKMAAESQFAEVVHWLGCLRGISTLTGFGLAVEIGDWHRFTGNTHAWRLLVDAAWHHRRAYCIGKIMRDRWDLAPAAARARGDASNRRLHNRWVRMLERKTRSTIANVAIARELAGWCWSLAVMDEQMGGAATG
ncbi:hypothetical protein [Kocuria sp. KD4]|uniref:hypothetical protein n=1 Tax=Kocuria sp. KD4 TaxID=2719588 RepID=UPI001F0EA1CF|nr:hypothetical protein [Kocuria sp. KD4]